MSLTTVKVKRALLVSMLAASSLAMAQAGGGGGGGGPAGNDPSPSATPNSTREGGDMQTPEAKSTTKKHHMKHSKATKPMTDTTNMPGADASSDTKGQ